MHSMVINNGYNGSHLNTSKIGELSLIQLKELRHRGAFSTVSLTFAMCCISCARSGDLIYANYPRQWYQESLAYMLENSSSLTRRSAGLPAMITGILGAYPTGEFFDEVVLDLQAIADGPIAYEEGAEEIELPQVHALNCLKDIFTDARFGVSAEKHMADTLVIAASCLESTMYVA